MVDINTSLSSTAHSQHEKNTFMDFYDESDEDNSEDQSYYYENDHLKKLMTNNEKKDSILENKNSLITSSLVSESSFSENSISLLNHKYEGKVENDEIPNKHLNSEIGHPLVVNNVHVCKDDEDDDDSESSEDDSFDGIGTRSVGVEDDSDADSSSSSNDHSYHGRNRFRGSNMWDKEYKQVREYARTESRNVQMGRYIVFGTLVLVGAIVSLATFRILHTENASKHHKAYESFSMKIEDIVRRRIQSIIESHWELSQSITLASIMKSQLHSSMEMNQNFSSSSIIPKSWRGGHNFETSASNAMKKSGIDFFCYAPIVVGRLNISAWANYTAVASSMPSRDWYEESKEIFDSLHIGSNRTLEPKRKKLDPIVWKFSPFDNASQYTEMSSLSLEAWDLATASADQVFVPRYVTSPPPPFVEGEEGNVIQNEDMFSDQDTKELSLTSSDVHDLTFSKFSHPLISALLHEKYQHCNDTDTTDNTMIGGCGRTLAVFPVYDSLQPMISEHVSNRNVAVVGYIYSIISWEKYLLGLIPEGVHGVNAMLQNDCGQTISFELTHEVARYAGTFPIDPTVHNYDARFINITSVYDHTKHPHASHSSCGIKLVVYHTIAFEESYESMLPAIITSLIAILFTIVAIVFFCYEYLVKSRDEKVDHAAAQSNAIVSSLFPSNVRDRLLAEHNDSSHSGHGIQSNQNDNTNKRKKKSSLKGFLAGERQDTEMLDSDFYKTKPIADLFPETTVMFGDIVGFTAWSSVREPSQVFTLLETLYRSFDEIANHRRVFKVETVGDCYVAVCGLPDARKDHAVSMARFARDCLYKMWTLTTKLEVTLGPETSELAMRVGLHSGPVTAGVLRGERARFQLFGDTMNTAARMESTGTRDRIHLSQETADLLVGAGKASWIQKREFKITAKGKGELQTYWLTLVDKSDKSFTHAAEASNGTLDIELHAQSINDLNNDAVHDKVDIKEVRMVQWNVEVLHRLLKQIVAQRQLDRKQLKSSKHLVLKSIPGQTVLDEVKEIITLPQRKGSLDNYDADGVELETSVMEQLTNYVTVVSSMYRQHPFHNFEHASHVAMSVSKLLSRIVAPSDHAVENRNDNSFSLHDHTYGITSDPLTQFACVFSALIHDIDHPGVPNSQLVKEQSVLAHKYSNKSAAEQHSVDLAWQILMEDKYNALRSTIYSDEIEMRRFRQLVVNSVMATDIVDKELKSLRNLRWDKAFSVVGNEENSLDTINRKATVVIEHLIQASDVAHTMQHWHVYRKWNGRFFMECYAAYKEGRAEADPSITWYKGEIGFFDFYIIPLARKLKDCGVFGVSSDEYLNYALKNREEWEQRGQEVLDELIEKVNTTYNT